MDVFIPMRQVSDAITKLIAAPLFHGIRHLSKEIQHRSDNLSIKSRRVFAVTISLILHVGLVLLLLTTKTGLTSIGTTGLGSFNGPGMAVTLVEATEIVPPQASEAQSSATEETASSPSVAAEEAVKPADRSVNLEDSKPADEKKSEAVTPAVTYDSQAPSDSTAAATAGAHGQNGTANTDLWNAIAPCWNKLATRSTLSATLTISFTDTGELSVAPIIERDPDAPITRQTLISEGKALAALKNCGAYPMAGGQKNVTVVFPAPPEN